jgi:EAL domain-containing protein (putative c-di-GMP-specific phosphodiesterase class I)
MPIVDLNGGWTKFEGLAADVPAYRALSPEDKRSHDLKMFFVGGRIVSSLQYKYPGLGYSGNVLPSDLAEPGFGLQLVGLAAASGLRLDLFTVEIVESQPLGLDDPVVIENLETLNRARVKLAFDDVGSGHMAAPHAVAELIGRLLQLGIRLSALKIDRNLVEKAETAEGQATIRRFVGLAGHIGATVIAEGVNTDQQLSLCLQLGCMQFQSFRMGKKMPVEHALRWLRRKRRPLAVLLKRPHSPAPITTQR